MFRKQKLRKDYDQRLIGLMTDIKKDWDQQKEILRLSYEQNDELAYRTLLAKAKYIFLLREAKERKISIKSE